MLLRITRGFEVVYAQMYGHAFSCAWNIYRATNYQNAANLRQFGTSLNNEIELNTTFLLAEIN